MVSRDVAQIAEIKTLKAALRFGDVAFALALKGSGRTGWDCPKCGGPKTLRESTHRQGGWCKACGEKMDILGLVMASSGQTAREAITTLKSIRDARDAPPMAGDLFPASAPD